MSVLHIVYDDFLVVFLSRWCLCKMNLGLVIFIKRFGAIESKKSFVTNDFFVFNSVLAVYARVGYWSIWQKQLITLSATFNPYWNLLTVPSNNISILIAVIQNCYFVSKQNNWYQRLQSSLNLSYCGALLSYTSCIK